MKDYLRKLIGNKKRLRTLICIVVLTIIVCVVSYALLPRDAMPTCYVVYTRTREFANRTSYGGVEFHRFDEDSTTKQQPLATLVSMLHPHSGYIHVRYDFSGMSLFIQKRDKLSDDSPLRVEIVRFPLQDVAERGLDLTFEDGIEVEWTKDGNYYKIDRAEDDNVYAARTYWNEGWIEYLWVVYGERKRVEPYIPSE